MDINTLAFPIQKTTPTQTKKEGILVLCKRILKQVLCKIEKKSKIIFKKMKLEIIEGYRGYQKNKKGLLNH